MEVILNIGLAREGNSNIGQGTVIRELTYSFKAIAFEFKHSDTEPTCIATVDALSAGYLKQSCEFLCRLLSQDCIAVWDPVRREGQLIGPKAEAWGPFNPEFFLLPGGERLAAQLARQQRQAQFGQWAEQRNAA